MNKLKLRKLYKQYIDLERKIKAELPEEINWCNCECSKEFNIVNDDNIDSLYIETRCLNCGGIVRLNELI